MLPGEPLPLDGKPFRDPMFPSVSQAAGVGGAWRCLVGTEKSEGSARSTEQVGRPHFLSLHGGQCPSKATGKKGETKEELAPK